MQEYPDGRKGLSSNYNEARVYVSMACSGKFIVRMVFKVLKQPAISNPAWKDCAFSRLTPDNYESSATPLVRCELELPPGPGSEDARAVKAKEKRCYICGYCSRGGGCPSTVSTQCLSRHC